MKSHCFTHKTSPNDSGSSYLWSSFILTPCSKQGQLQTWFRLIRTLCSEVSTIFKDRDPTPLKANYISLSSRTGKTPCHCWQNYIAMSNSTGRVSSNSISSCQFPITEFLHWKQFLSVFFKAQPFPEVILPKLTKLWVFSQKYFLFLGIEVHIFTAVLWQQVDQTQNMFSAFKSSRHIK